jgi:hypothetical protein
MYLYQNVGMHIQNENEIQILFKIFVGKNTDG